VATVAGAVNAVTSGGTLLTFPALVRAAQVGHAASTVSTLSFYPDQLGSLRDSAARSSDLGLSGAIAQ
jgi:hypothetical protein